MWSENEPGPGCKGPVCETERHLAARARIVNERPPEWLKVPEPKLAGRRSQGPYKD